jgi:transposase
MEKNVSFSAGPLILMERIEEKYNLFGILFEGLGGKAKNLKESAKLLAYNKLADSIAICRIKEIYPYELFEDIGFKKNIAERNIYRNLARIGDNFKFIMPRYERFLDKNDLISDKQFMDFSSAYFEGKGSNLGALGYSRDGKPGKNQITFGVSTGMNGIPTALTIQKGNVCDKKHFKYLFKTAKKILNENSLLIFDCGANTNKNKERIINAKLNYLTLVAKKRKTYQKFLLLFRESKNKEIFTLNNIKYKCVKISENRCYKYIFFNKKAKADQLKKRKKRFIKELEKNSKLLPKVKKGKPLKTVTSSEGLIISKGILQKNLGEAINPFITGLEGYFVLESSVDESPEKVLKLYKERDRAEKLIRDIKEGTDLRPIRHWSKNAIIGYVLVVFLTNCLIQLTHFLSKNSVVKNVKLLKKYLMNLTVTVIYYPNRPKVRVFSNISEEIVSVLGNFVEKYRKRTLDYWR